jgi:hypothetical protein
VGLDVRLFGCHLLLEFAQEKFANYVGMCSKEVGEPRWKSVQFINGVAACKENVFRGYFRWPIRGFGRFDLETS